MAFTSLFKELQVPFSVTVLSIVTVALLLKYVTRKKHKLPPGPWGLPYFGYAPFLGKFPHHTFHKLSKKYGNIFSFKLLGKTAIVLEDLQHIKEGLGNPAFLGAGFDASSVDIFVNGSGLFELNGKPWQEQRRFVVKVLKEIGFANDRFADLFKEEISEFRHLLEKMNGKPIEFFQEVTYSLTNVILGVVTLKRFEYDHPTALFLKNVVNQFVFYFEGSDLFFLPIIKKILSFFQHDDSYKNIKTSMVDMDNWFQQQVEEHKKDIDRTSPRDFIDCYLIEMEIQQTNPDTSFTERNLLAMAEMLFLTGNVDTRSALYWLILIMAGYPDVQSRVQEQIDEVLGRERFPTWEDHVRLPYAVAVIRESHRWKTAIPVGCIRNILEDTTTGGYYIPKGSLIFPNIWAVHNDNNVWKDPEIFRPERHLSADGSTLLYHENFLPFSYGKRQCPGEKFANMEMFLYLVALLQQFDIRMPEGQEADFTEEIELNVHPRSQLICFIPRQ